MQNEEKNDNASSNYYLQRGSFSTEFYATLIKNGNDLIDSVSELVNTVSPIDKMKEILKDSSKEKKPQKKGKDILQQFTHYAFNQNSILTIINSHNQV